MEGRWGREGYGLLGRGGLCKGVKVWCEGWWRYEKWEW